MKSWKRWALLALFIGLLAVGIQRALHKRQQQQAAAQQSVQNSTTAVPITLSAGDVFVAQNTELQQTLDFTGNLRAVHSAAIKARAAGEVRGLLVREGDTVQAGQVLAHIDATEAQARVRQAEQQVHASQAQLTIAQRQHDNNQTLVQQNFISSTAALNTQTTLDASRANWQAAQAALDIARKGLADTEVRAPISGQVAAKLVQDGERVAIDNRLLEIVDTRQMEIEVALPPSAATQVRIGQKARWTLEGQTQSSSAQVVRISPSVQTGSRSVLAYLSVPTQTGLHQGLFVQGLLAIGKMSGIAIPANTVRHDKPVPYLQLLVAGQVKHQPITIGASGYQQQTEMLLVPELSAGSVVLRPRVGLLPEGTAAQLPGAPAVEQPNTQQAE